MLSKSQKIKFYLLLGDKILPGNRKPSWSLYTYSTTYVLYMYEIFVMHEIMWTHKRKSGTTLCLLTNRWKHNRLLLFAYSSSHNFTKNSITSCNQHGKFVHEITCPNCLLVILLCGQPIPQLEAPLHINPVTMESMDESH